MASERGNGRHSYFEVDRFIDLMHLSGPGDDSEFSEDESDDESDEVFIGRRNCQSSASESGSDVDVPQPQPAKSRSLCWKR